MLLPFAFAGADGGVGGKFFPVVLLFMSVLFNAFEFCRKEFMSSGIDTRRSSRGIGYGAS